MNRLNAKAFAIAATLLSVITWIVVSLNPVLPCISCDMNCTRFNVTVKLLREVQTKYQFGQMSLSPTNNQSQAINYVDGFVDPWGNKIAYGIEHGIPVFYSLGMDSNDVSRQISLNNSQYGAYCK